MRSRGQLALALALVASVALGGTALDRAGRKAASALGAGPPISGAWYCPHGGGQKDWTVTLEVADPGDRPSTVRVTTFGDRKPAPPRTFAVGPGSTLAVPVPATGRGASSLVESFGGWVAVGWVALAGGAQSGVAAEPCADRTGSTWFAPDGDTTKGQQASLVVMNPFAGRAVFDVVLYTKDRAPLRASDLTDVVLPAERSVALSLNAEALDEPAVSAEVDVRRGRVAVASLGVGLEGGIRSSIGTIGHGASRSFFTATTPADLSTLVVLDPTLAETRFDATVLTPARGATAGDLTEQGQGGQSAQTYPVTASGPSSVEVTANGPPVIVARRVAGPTIDQGATAGATAPAAAWVVTPTVACDPNVPGLVVVDPGTAPATVTLHALPNGEGPTPADVTFQVAPGRAASAPDRFLSVDPTAAVLVTAPAGAVLASGASSSCGQEGLAGFAVAGGIAVPSGVLGAAGSGG